MKGHSFDRDGDDPNGEDPYSADSDFADPNDEGPDDFVPAGTAGFRLPPGSDRYLECYRFPSLDLLYLRFCHFSA